MVENHANNHFFAKDRSRPELVQSPCVRIAVIPLVVLGCALSRAQYVGQVSLWHDELAIALNVEQRGVRQLLTEPLAHKQMAPVGFLAAVAVRSKFFGVNELGVRLVPWLF